MSPVGGEGDQAQPGLLLQQFARTLMASWSDRIPDPDDLVEFATRSVPNAIGVGLTRISRDGEPMTLAASSELAATVDRIEYEAGEGPCLDALEHDDITVANDLTRDRRWPKFSERAVRETPVRSMFGARIFLSGDERGALNFYAAEVGSFNDLDVGIGATMSTLSTIALRTGAERRRGDNLEIALESSRLIGVAMGILMASRLLTADQAFEALRRVSQDTNRKLRDVAGEVAETGALPERRVRGA